MEAKRAKEIAKHRLFGVYWTCSGCHATAPYDEPSDYCPKGCDVRLRRNDDVRFLIQELVKL